MECSVDVDITMIDIYERHQYAAAATYTNMENDLQQGCAECCDIEQASQPL